MKALGHEVIVVSGGGGGPLTRQLEQRGVQHVVIPSLGRALNPFKDAYAVGQLARLLRSFEPDIVTTHSSKAGVIGRLAARLSDVPAVFTAHGWAFAEGVGPAGVLYRGVEQMMARFSDRIITVSDQDRRLAIDARVGRPDQLVTIHYGMPVDPPGSVLADPGEQPARLVMVARFERQKDHGTLLRALAATRDLPWSLDLVGDGPLFEQARALAEALGLSERVQFLGSRDDVPSILARAQLFVLISNWEGLPLSILEAMRAGLPVVASDVNGVGESVNDAVGRLVPRGNVDYLAFTLREVLTRPDLRVSLGREARRRFLADFSFDSMFNKTLALYRDVAVGSGGA